VVLRRSLKDLGVLAGKTGPDRNVLTFMPPLTISRGQLGDLIDVLKVVVD
jgi:4-aminobutyrate aminotransferase-like enzyme